MDGATDLELLVRSRYPLILVETLEEERLEQLCSRVASQLEVPFFRWSRTRGLVREDLDKSVYETTDPLKLLAHLSAARVDGIFLLADFQPYLAEPVTVRKLRETAQLFTGDRRALVLSGTNIQLPPELARQSVPFHVALPDEDQLFSELTVLARELARTANVDVKITADQARSMARSLRGLTLGEARRALRRTMLTDGTLDAADFDRLLDSKREALGRDGLLEYYAPSETREPVAGLSRLKAWLSKRESAFSPEAQAFGLESPRGILLLGVQGCGKSLIARGIAGSWNLPLARLDPGVLFDKYVGETERNLRRALTSVEAMAPIVLWIDEIEKGFTARSGDEDGGTSQRFLGTFLTWFQERQADVFVVATANDISTLPPELLRKGRFDEIFFVDLPTETERASILEVHLAKRERDPSAFDVEDLARCSPGFSGAELEQAIVAGLYTAFDEGREVDTATLRQEIEAAIPLSVTMSERVNALRRWAHGRAVQAS